MMPAAAKPNAYPKLPKRVRGAGGWIRVISVKRPGEYHDKGFTVTHGEPCWGSWEPSTRTIRVEKGAPRAFQWRVYFHELTHAAIEDAGLHHLLADSSEETLCDALATARTQEMHGQLQIDV